MSSALPLAMPTMVERTFQRSSYGALRCQGPQETAAGAAAAGYCRPWTSAQAVPDAAFAIEYDAPLGGTAAVAAAEGAAHPAAADSAAAAAAVAAAASCFQVF